jgi:4-hydroxybenzoate polyprenyltransferase
VTATAPPDGQVIAGRSLAVRFLNFVKFPHTLFALPFALLGVVAASLQVPVGWRLVLLVVVAFTAARWVALGLNMIADIRFDAANPRNRGRPLPQGQLTLPQAWASVAVAAVVFLAAAAAINPLTRLLAPVALGWVALYPLTKRFTHWPHIWLGMSLAIAPVGGWLAVTGRWSDPWWVLAAITMAVATWVAGFDIFYALPDEQFDRSQGLRSAVVRLGVRRAILLAKVLHGVTIPALALFGWGAGFGAVYYAGVVVAAGVLAYEHQLVRPDDLSKLGAAFFNMNAILSGTVFLFALADRLI